MPLPLIIPLLGAGALAFALMKASQHADFPHLPPELNANLKWQLAENKNPAQLRQLAFTLRQTGNLVRQHNPEGSADYFRAATALEARANELEQSGRATPGVVPGGAANSPNGDPVAQIAQVLAQGGQDVTQIVPGMLSQAAPPAGPAGQPRPPVPGMVPPFIPQAAPPVYTPVSLPIPMPSQAPPFFPGMPGAIPAQVPPLFPGGPSPGVVPVFVPPSGVNPGAMPLIQDGSHGPAVLTWQQAMQKSEGLDFSSGPGTFGPRTKAATISFQKKQGLGADGQVGPQTWSAASRAGLV